MRPLLAGVWFATLSLVTAPDLDAVGSPLVDLGVLEAVDAAREPVFSEKLQSFILGLPSVEQIMAKGDSDIVEEVRFARARIDALREPGQSPAVGGGGLSEATGVVLVLSHTQGALKVKGALSCVCIDRQSGLFLTALHPFQEADRGDCAVILGRDGSVSGVARTLLRKTEADIVLLTTRSIFTGQVRRLGEPPTAGEMLWVCGSCPGAAFFQLGAHAARVSLPNWHMLGRLRAKCFDLDRGFPNGLSGGGVFNSAGELVGIATRNIAVSSHGTGGAALQFGRAVEIVPVVEELR